MTWKVWLVLASLAGVSGFGVLRIRAKHDAAEEKYATLVVDRGSISARVNANGTLSALVTVQVGSQVSGRIREIQVDFNSKVKKGQVLAVIDPALFQAAVAQARAHLAAAVGELAKSNANARIADTRLKRSKELADKKLIAEADLDQAITDAESTKAQVDAALGNVAEAQAALQQCQVNLTYTTIKSPIDGVVISRNIDVGQTVAASLQAPTLFTIAGDLAKMQVDTSVAEADVGKLKSGMPATFTVDAYPNLTFKGTVREVRNAPQMIQNVVTYDAVIDVDNSEMRLKPGMTAHVSFVYAEKASAVRVSNRALRYRPTSGGESRKTTAQKPSARSPSSAQPRADERSLWILKDHSAAQVRIRTGISDGTTTEIVDGPLRPGDRVIVGLIENGDAERSASDGPASGRLF